MINNARPVIPGKMVTHNWSNLFRDMLAAVLADALGEHTFDFITRLLNDGRVDLLEQSLLAHGCLHDAYWICAFAVNQHAGICGLAAREMTLSICLIYSLLPVSLTSS